MEEAEKRTTGRDEGRSGSDAKRYLLLIVTAGESSRRAGEVALWLAESLGLELRRLAAERGIRLVLGREIEERLAV